MPEGTLKPSADRSPFGLSTLHPSSLHVPHLSFTSRLVPHLLLQYGRYLHPVVFHSSRLPPIAVISRLDNERFDSDTDSVSLSVSNALNSSTFAVTPPLDLPVLS